MHRMTLEFESIPESELYLVLNDAFLEGDMSEQAVAITVKTAGHTVSYNFRPDDYKYHTGQEDYVINIGYFEEPVTSCEVELDRAESICLESMELWCQPMHQTKEYTEKLTEDVLEHVKVGTNQVSGQITAEKDKILTLSIPYQKGWTAFVDGQKTELQRANYMYMALPIEAGEHVVELKFEIPGVFTALWIMAVSAGSFIILILIDAVRKGIYKFRKRKHCTDEKES